jgi:hypothetical protein
LMRVTGVDPGRDAQFRDSFVASDPTYRTCPKFASTLAMTLNTSSHLLVIFLVKDI